jgi:flagellin
MTDGGGYSGQIPGLSGQGSAVACGKNYNPASFMPIEYLKVAVPAAGGEPNQASGIDYLSSISAHSCSGESGSIGSEPGRTVSLSILNNVSSLLAENALAQASAGQQKALQQLSTGLRINSSADDAAGLSIANGLQANIAALTQSVSNANNGIGFLQVAGGALSQVTGLLNRAVTLATEAASSGLTGQQRGAADTEYQSILTEINQIGTTTEFNSTQVFTDGNNSPVALANNGSTVTATINPLDTLTGGMTVTSTVPGLGGTTTAITASTSGTTTTAAITPGATLSGSLTINSSSAEIDGAGELLSFTASGDGSSITSSPIITGDTLSGTLVINSSGGNASDSDIIQLTSYRGLSSSNSITATNAANQLASDMTTAMEGTTGSTYTASINSGVLTIQTSNSVTAPSPIRASFSPDTYILLGTGFYQGATLAGTLAFTSSGAADGSGIATIDFTNYQGLTSANSATQNAALTKLGNDLTTSLGAETGSTYTALFVSDGRLVIESSNSNENFAVSLSNVTATPVIGTQNVTMTDQDGEEITSSEIAPGSAVSGMLNIDATGPTGPATASIDLGNSSYSALFSSNGLDSAWAQINLQNTLQTDLAATGQPYNVDIYHGTLRIETDPGGNISTAFSTLQATLSGGEALSVDPSTIATQADIIPGASTSQTISLAGQTTAGLQSYLQGQLSDYAVSYNNTSGALSIALNSSNPGGYTTSTGTSAASQNVGGTAAVNTPEVVSLAGLTKTNLASTLLTQLGSNYTVGYDQTSGALSIGISSAGTTAGIASISSSNNTVQETAAAGSAGLSAFDVFTSDGTTGGSTSLDITVGSLTTANLGTSNGSAGVDLSASDLLTQAAAASTLGMITAAVNDISSQRGVVGANINRLTATASDESATQINLTSAMNSIQNADIGKTVANMTQYNILQSTGMAALQQANQAQQAVLKLIQ